MKNLSSRTPASNEIFYTSSDGNVIEPYYTDGFCANIVSNTYKNGRGVIVFDAPVTKIGYEAFRNCSSLTSVTIGNSVTKIGEGAFLRCSSLKDIYVNITDLAAYCTSNPMSAIGGNKHLLVDGVEITELVIPNSVTEIGSWAFSDCSSLTSVTIPDSVTEIGEDALRYCSSLTSVTIPDSVTEIGSWAFSGCRSLTSVTIPDSVTKIGQQAFEYCSSLTSVYCKPTTPPTGGYSMFNANASGRKIYVPRESVNAYKSAEGWGAYASAIVGYDF